MNVTGLPPAHIIQGDSYEWTTAVSTYSSVDGWLLTTHFRAPSGALLSIAGTGNPDGSWTTTLGLLASEGLVPGATGWQLSISPVSGPPRRHTICTGRTFVSVPLSGAAPDEILTPAERRLAALEQLGAEVLATGYAEMELDGAKSVFRSWDEYQRALNAARQDVLNEAAALPTCGAPTGNPKKVLVYFTDPRI